MSHSTVEKIGGLLVEARQFLRAGGVLTRSEWTQMGDEERLAYVQAGKELRLESAVLAGLASTDLKINTLGGSGAVAKTVKELVDALKRMEGR